MDLLGCDFYKVPVFNFEFVDVDNEQYLEFTTKHGQKLTKPYKGEIQDNEELKANEIRYVRKGKWIVGTEHLFDYGKWNTCRVTYTEAPVKLQGC
jgi:phage terminase large subunit